MVRANRTFTHIPTGKLGVLADRPVYVAVSSGGSFASEPARQPDFLTPYLTAILNTIGLRTIHFRSSARRRAATRWRARGAGPTPSWSAISPPSTPEIAAVADLRESPAGRRRAGQAPHPTAAATRNEHPLLILCPIAERHLDILSQRFDVTYAITNEARKQAVQERGHAFRAVLTIGTIGLSGEEIAAMPKLELVSCMGAGYETVDAGRPRAALS